MTLLTLPSISIVTPTLNQAGYIRAAIDSVLGQGYPALEYRVLDGGSTDGTLEVLREYGSRLSWASGADRGQTDAINRGWRESGGEILGWLNSDDFYFPGALQRVGEFFFDHPQIDWMYGDGVYVDAAGRELKAYPAQAYDYPALLVEALNFIPQPAAFIRRRVFESAGPLDDSLHFVMDFEYWLRAGLQHPAAYLPGRLAALRLHPAAKSVEQLGRFACELVSVYSAYFQHAGLPEGIRREERRAMSNAYLRAADCAFWAGSLAEARAYAWRSFIRRPLRPRRLWASLALGRLGYRLATRLQANPYLGGGSGQ